MLNNMLRTEVPGLNGKYNSVAVAYCCKSHNLELEVRFAKKSDRIVPSAGEHEDTWSFGVISHSPAPPPHYSTSVHAH